jgi:hypothetical protein
MVLSLVFGVLVDLDHFIDYWYAEGRICFDAKTFLRTRYWQKSGRLFVFFHAFEYLPLVFLVWQAFKGRKWAVAATAAMSSHVLADHFINELKPLGYFILYRAAHGFRAGELLDWEGVRRVEARYAERNRRKEEGTLPWYSRLAGQFI